LARSWPPDNTWGKSKIILSSNLMTRFLVIKQAEPRTPRIDCALIRTDDKSSPAPLTEDSAPGDEEGAVVASPDRKRDRAKWDWGQDHPTDDPRYGVLLLRPCQSPVMDRQVSCLAVGECWPAVFGNRKPGIRNSVPCILGLACTFPTE
jgi:hypothetical protein